MPRPRKVSDAMRELIAKIARARRELPTDKDLASQAGCSSRAIQQIMRKELLRVSELSISTTESTVTQCQKDTEASR